MAGHGSMGAWSDAIMANLQRKEAAAQRVRDAAPDLLAALKSAVLRMDHKHDADEDCPCDRCEAFTAIAKAEKA